MAYKEEMERVLEAALLVVDEGTVESYGVKANSLWVFMKVLRDRRRFMNIYQSSVDKLDKVEFRFII